MANSCNYILPIDNMSIHTLLAILNSKVLNCFCRCFSTNSNVNGYELDKFPLSNVSEQLDSSLSELSRDIQQSNNHEYATEISNRIDHIVYHLYGLTYDEALIVDPETPITREEYESFQLD